MKKISTLFLCLCLTCLLVKADEIRLISASTGQVTVGFITSSPTTVRVDWGNGSPIDYQVTETDMNGMLTQASGVPSGEIIVTGDNIIVFECGPVTGDDWVTTNMKITNLDVTKAPGLKKLSFNGNLLTSVDLSKNVELYSLHAETNPGITTLDLSKNDKLQVLYCNDNGLTSLDVSNNPLITILNINNNKISSLDLTKNTALGSLYALGNLIESADVSKNTNLTYISFNNNKLTSLDVSGLTALKSLFLLNNQIVELIGADNVAATGTLNCSGNKLNLSTLPQPGALRSQFNYAPQQAYVLPQSVALNEELDLSSQTNVKGVLAEPVLSAFLWETESGVALVKDTDYEENNGVFKFIKLPAEKVICKITSLAFPKFSGNNVLKTTPVEIKGNSGLDNPGNDKYVVKKINDRIVVSGLSGNEQIKLFNLSGQVVFGKTADKQEEIIEIESSGVFVLTIDGAFCNKIVK